YSGAFFIGTLVDQGRYAQAQEFVEQHREEPRIGDGARLFDQARAGLLLAQGEPARAVEILDGYADPAGRAANPAWFEERSLRARALAALGHRAEALALAEEDCARH